MAITEYKPGTTFPGVIGRTAEVSKPAWPEPNRAKEGAPNVLFIVLDDTGFGHLGCYGSPIADPQHRRAGRRWPALQQHAHDGALLAVALLHHHRPQPPFQPFGLSHQWLDGVSGIRRLHPVREWLPLGDPAAEGLQHLLPRQVASGPGGDDDGSRPLRPLAVSVAGLSVTTAS